MKVGTSITVRFQQPGFHCWPAAPSNRAYLRDTHRHLFHVEVTIPVKHQDREVEFHDLQDAARQLFAVQLERGSQSCEMMAEKLAERLCQAYERSVTVTVSEDRECDATVQWEPAS